MSEGGLYELALYAGGGGGLLASRWLLGWKTVCYVENASYPVEIIKARIRDGLLDDAPIWDDARTFDGRPWAGLVDIITAGFPCQPFSAAGEMRGADDPRNGWPATIRIIREVRPRYLLLENVANLITFEYFKQILGEIAALGYVYRWDVLSAAGSGAPHLRKRVWIVAHADGKHREELEQSAVSGRQAFVPTLSSWWNAEPGVGRVAHGVAYRVDRIAALGNGQVPAVVRRAWLALKGVDE